MSRRCAVTGKTILVGRNVSHANNKTKRRFMPNLQMVSLVSDALRGPVQLRMSTSGLRTVEAAGGIDAWLAAQSRGKLAPELRKLRQRIDRAKARGASA
jgi:large subunit ribosomal protein L28